MPLILDKTTRKTSLQYVYIETIKEPQFFYGTQRNYKLFFDMWFKSFFVVVSIHSLHEDAF